MSDIDYGCNADSPVDIIAVILDNAQTASVIMRELDALGFEIVPKQNANHGAKDMNDNDGKPGLRIESAASVTARDMIQKHVNIFAHVIRTDRAAGQSTVAAYIDGLAGVAALTIAGGHGSQEEVRAAVVGKLLGAIDRDLRHLGKT